MSLLELFDAWQEAVVAASQAANNIHSAEMEAEGYTGDLEPVSDLYDAYEAAQARSSALGAQVRAAIAALPA